MIWKNNLSIYEEINCLSWKIINCKNEMIFSFIEQLIARRYVLDPNNTDVDVIIENFKAKDYVSKENIIKEFNRRHSIGDSWDDYFWKMNQNLIPKIEVWSQITSDNEIQQAIRKFIKKNWSN